MEQVTMTIGVMNILWKSRLWPNVAVDQDEATDLIAHSEDLGFYNRCLST